MAVGLVVAFHAGLPYSAGGFIGVDVFFVVSGFLITRLLLAERERTGTISLAGFWSRRARRLLPAACLTLVVTLVAAQFVLPPLQRRAVTLDGLFSAVFLANLRFSETLGDYFGNQLAETYPSPFLHYWSLAVEEQFYLVWPVLVLLAMRVGRHPRRTLAAVATVMATASLALAVWWTPRRPEAAFYLLPARMCELLVGALLAIAGPAVLARTPVAVRSALGWLGLVAIATATVTFSDTTPFPGSAVLMPMLGTAALLVAGSGPGSQLGPHRLLELQPLQWIGARSYAIYLWHWPVLVLFHAYDPTRSPIQRLVAVLASVALAHVSTELVENPVRFARSLVAPARRGLVLGLGLTTCSVAVAGAVWVTQPDLDGGAAASAVTLVTDAPPTTVGTAPATTGTTEPSPPTSAPRGRATPTVAEVRPTTPATTTHSSPPPPDDGRSRLDELEAEMQVILDRAASTIEVPSNLRPSLVDAARDTAQVYHDRCISLGDDSEIRDCRYGARDSATRFLLFGDSHAAQWFPAMETIAADRDAELVVLLKGGCPVADVPSTRADLVASCPSWRRAAIARAVELEPDIVVMSSLSGYTSDELLWQSGLTDVLRQLEQAADRLVVILDTPRAAGAPPICLSGQLRSADNCVNQRSEAVHTERAAAERAAAADVDAEIVDPTSWLCGRTVCPVIVGDALMYRDVDHMTTVASRMLTPLLDAALFP